MALQSVLEADTVSEGLLWEESELTRLVRHLHRRGAAVVIFPCFVQTNIP